jgi:hypothetical protein
MLDTGTGCATVVVKYPTSVPFERLSGHAKPDTLRFGCASAAGLFWSDSMGLSVSEGWLQSALLFLRKKIPARNSDSDRMRTQLSV